MKYFTSHLSHAKDLDRFKGRIDVLTHSQHFAYAAEDFHSAGMLAYARLTRHLRDGGFGLRGSL